MVEKQSSFSASLLENGASAFGGFAASSLLEKVPAVAERFGDGALASWRTHLTQRVLQLAAAVECGDPAVFESQVLWSRRAFSGRGRDPRDIEASLEALREVLLERLPATAKEEPLAFIEGALQSLRAEAEDDGAMDLDPHDAHQRIALRYLERILSGDPRRAINDLVAVVDEGTEAVDVLSRILLPAQREIGRLWHLGKASISEEHMVTATTREAIAVIAHASDPVAENGKTVVAAAVAGNAHDVGLRAASVAFELAGWRAVCLGADVPSDELPRALTQFDADLLLLSTMLTVQLSETRRAVDLVRGRARSDIKILVGGTAFDTSHDLWRWVGADGYAGTIESAVVEGGRLLGL